MNIAIDCRLMYYRKAGITYYTRRLVQAMADESSRFTFYALHDRRDTDVAWVPRNVNVIRTVTPAHYRYEHMTLPLELARFKFDVLHSPDFITCRGRFRKVITIHDLYFMEHPEVMSADGARYYSRMRWSAKTADRIIAVSRFTRNDILRLMPEVDARKISVVYEAADKLEVRSKKVEEMPLLTSNLSLPYILFVGTLEPRKNLATLLRALIRLPKDIRLVVVGAVGWRDGEPAQLAREFNLDERVTLAGRVSDAELDALYRAARLLAMPSLTEGFGLPMLEAMARGAPVVCSNSGSLPEIAGHAALLHAPLDDAELARHIHELWTDERLHMDYSQRGMARAKQFSWERAARETMTVYQSVVGNR